VVCQLLNFLRHCNHLLLVLMVLLGLPFFFLIFFFWVPPPPPPPQQASVAPPKHSLCGEGVRDPNHVTVLILWYSIYYKLTLRFGLLLLLSK
jgi:hypothetical protein